MKIHHNTTGFSLVELMIVLVLVLSISAAIFQTINMTTQRTATEQTKVDMFQEAREFMDQMSRDLRQAGYPNQRNMDPSVITATNPMDDLHVAAGLVKVADGEMWTAAASRPSFSTIWPPPARTVLACSGASFPRTSIRIH
jgi:prepilin-type N-terminal cleavage/methylation domain-containing protein